MIAGLKKLLSLERRQIQHFAATLNDTVYATPRDYMKLILNEHGIKGQVAMCFVDKSSLVLLVRTNGHIPYETTATLKKRLLERIHQSGGCRIPQEIFWATGAPDVRPTN